MSDDHKTQPPAPPAPLPKRRNTVLRLFDAPLHRDGVFVFMVVVVVFSIIGAATGGTSGDPPQTWATWVIGLPGALVLVGILPAWIRLRRRREQWEQPAAPGLGS